MQHLQINNLTFKYQDIDIFTNLNLSFQPFSWNCIVGNNGSGKTTLLKLIAKKIKPESGNIIGNELVYYCRQNLDKTPECFEEFIYTFNSKTFRLKELLHIQDEWFYRWETLSYGEKKRVQIAIVGDNGVGKSSFFKHIISKIDLNNNYLYLPQEIEENQIEKLYEEIDFFEAIEKVLLVYEKALIVVSHDKTFIKNLNLEIWNINKKNNKDFFILKSM